MLHQHVTYRQQTAKRVSEVLGWPKLIPESHQFVRNLMDQQPHLPSTHYPSIPTTNCAETSESSTPQTTILTAKMAAQAPQLRSLYRRFLREIPTRSPSLLANPSPLQKHIRSDIAATSSSNSPSLSHQMQTKSSESRAQEAEQFLQFAVQQRIYSTLVERYNPGMNMDEEERVRLTARRVGMELPIERMMGKKNEE